MKPKISLYLYVNFKIMKTEIDLYVIAKVREYRLKAKHT